jgi:hypothetical protein
LSGAVELEEDDLRFVRADASDSTGLATRGGWINLKLLCWQAPQHSAINRKIGPRVRMAMSQCDILPFEKKEIAFPVAKSL